MKPRLPTSVKWTPFPAEFTNKVKLVFEQNFKNESQAGEFLVEGRIYPGEILLRVGYLEKGQIRQANFEASIDFDAEKQKPLDQIYLCIDAAADMMNAYFESRSFDEEEQVDFPRSWQAFEYEEGEIHLQFSTVNTRLEEEADRLLGLGEKRLVYEDEAPTEDALDNSLVVDNELAKEIQKRMKEKETH